MKRLILYTFIIFVFNALINAQEIQRQGNNFVKVFIRKPLEPKETKTQYTYTDSKGNVYPIYLSSTGKAFIKKVSKKTGKEYKQYLPKVSKQINGINK